MKIQRMIAFPAVILLAISFTACTRSIPGSNKPAKTQTTEIGSAAQPVSGPTDVLEQIYLFATQTAMATQGLTTGLPPAQNNPQTTPIAPEGTIENPALSTLPSEQIIPTAKPVRIAPTTTPGLPTTYTLRKSEFPYCIARRFNVDPGELLRMNDLTSYSVYYGGMVIKIPQSGKTFPGERSLRSHPETYVVRPGDTFFSIACIYGDVDPEAIAFVNYLSVDDKLEVGQELNIP